MPLYLCNAKKGAIEADAKAKIAKDVTDIHCEETGAPATFVHVFFFEDGFAPPLADAAVMLQGNIRAGRTADQKATMTKRMRQSIAHHTGAADSAIAVALTDVPASWVMEGGDLLPEPGEEEAWLEAHEAKLAAEAAS